MDMFEPCISVITMLFEKWNFEDPTINKGPDSVYNKPYTKLHRDGKFTELDVLMNEAESRTKT